jgi:type II secretory pathway predicted ATPase ExeA
MAMVGAKPTFVARDALNALALRQDIVGVIEEDPADPETVIRFVVAEALAPASSAHHEGFTEAHAVNFRSLSPSTAQARFIQHVVEGCGGAIEDDRKPGRSRHGKKRR